MLQGTAGYGVGRGTQGTFPSTGRDGSEGGEAFHMPSGVTYVTYFFFLFFFFLTFFTCNHPEYFPRHHLNLSVALDSALEACEDG